jgi:hypothetical protein
LMRHKRVGSHTCRLTHTHIYIYNIYINIHHTHTHLRELGDPARRLLARGRQLPVQLRLRLQLRAHTHTYTHTYIHAIMMRSLH